MRDRELLTQAGFVVEGTGGGCKAYVRREQDGTTWAITAVDDPSLPAEGAPCQLGRYDAGVWDGDAFNAHGDNGPTAGWTFPTIAEAINAVLEVQP